MKITLRNAFLVFRDQLPLRRILKNIRNGNLVGLFHERSHLTHSGDPKIAYGSKASATRAAEKMQKKTGNYFSNYKCLYCNGYHLGKNRDSNLIHPDEAKWNRQA